MAELVMDYRANPGALGASVGAVYFNLSGQMCYVLNDGVEHPITPGVAVDNEDCGGVMNSSNATFTVLNVPISGSERIFLNGVRLRKTTGYTIVYATKTITMLAGYIPASGDTLVADYRY